MGLGIKTRIKSTNSALRYGFKTSKVYKNKYLKALLLCHSLEKGMGIIDVKKGYGKQKASDLIDVLEQLKSSGYKNTYEYRECLAILKAYFSYQDRSGCDVSELKEKAKSLLEDNTSPYKGGYQILKKEDMLKGSQIDYSSFVSSRHSMRTYNKAPIDKKTIMEAVSLAKRAPSACNRQPWKFYYTLDQEKAQKIASALPAQSFLKDIPYFGIVVVDKSLFNLSEINQWFINGGIFINSLVLAFHSLGIGSCIFQYPIFMKTKDEIRKLLGIPESEEIISFLGFGYYPDEAKCIYADRRPDEMIAVEV